MRVGQRAASTNHTRSGLPGASGGMSPTLGQTRTPHLPPPGAQAHEDGWWGPAGADPSSFPEGPRPFPAPKAFIMSRSPPEWTVGAGVPTAPAPGASHSTGWVEVPCPAAQRGPGPLESSGVNRSGNSSTSCGGGGLAHPGLAAWGGVASGAPTGSARFGRTPVLPRGPRTSSFTA